MSERLNAIEMAVYQERCITLYGDTISRRGRALQFDERRFVVDCFSCQGTGARQPRPGVHDRGGSFVCPRCRGAAIEVVGVMAAHNIAAGKVEYMPGWDRERALRVATGATVGA